MPDAESAANAGPLKTVEAFGRQVPYYVIRFDKYGSCLSPNAVEHLIAGIGANGVRDILLYSHGWNNDFPTSTALYDRFVRGLSEMDAVRHRLPAQFNPVFVGISWPSTALTFGAEDGPDIAAVAPDEEKLALIDALPAEDRDRASDILAAPEVKIEDAKQLAEMLAKALGASADGEIGAGNQDASEILAAWASFSDDPEDTRDGFTDFGTVTPPPGGPSPAAEEPEIAGWPTLLDPRWIVRLGTVLIMKDRAGIVGANGVADLVRRCLDETDARLFLFGHSYGAKVVMTALGALGATPPRRKADGALLLQPAVSRLCFAADVGDGAEGGYVRALPRVRQPIFLTHSSRDVPLTRLFHLVARRALDLGEMQMAGEPSRFAALGGYGASNCAPGTSVKAKLPAAGSWLAPLGEHIRVVSFDGSDSISGHGDINRAETFWAALNLMK